MPTTKSVSVEINFPDDDSVITQISKRRVKVSNGESVILEWTIPAGQGSFHETNPFTWNTSATNPAPPTVTRVSNGKLESTEYTNTVQGETSLTWHYTLRVVRDLAAVSIDPEVDN